MRGRGDEADAGGTRRRADRMASAFREERARRAAEAAAEPPPLPDLPLEPPPPLMDRPLLRAGLYAWSLIGLAIVVLGVLSVIGLLSVVVVPLVLALFPAAVLAPPTQQLRRLGLPPAAAAAATLLGFILVLALFFTLLAPSVADELGDLGASLEEGYERLRDFLESGPFGLDPVPVDGLIAQAQERLADSELTARIGEYAIAVGEGLAGAVLLLLALFFYLKDGAKIAAWLRDVFPLRFRADAAAIGERVWSTIGSYFRGQLLVALVDAVFIGIGLLVLRVPLVLPLAVLTFFGGLFPIVGAFAAGAVAVLVALATGGPAQALGVLAVIVAVQQMESHLLQPIVLGRATSLHPLAVIAALAAGGVLLGVLGAFLAVPVAASVARAVGYLRTRVAG